MKQIFASILLIITAVAIMTGAIYILSEKRLNSQYDMPVKRIENDKSEPDIERGKHLFTSVALCADCHGENLSGNILSDDQTGRITAPNLTRGEGSAVNEYSETDWIRAVRHGIERDNKSLLKMPSNIYFYLSDKDLLSIIKYIESVDPIDNVLPASEMRLPGRFLLVINRPSILTAETINHYAPRPVPPQLGITAEYGRYLAIIGRCLDCHGSDLTGVPKADFQPESQPAPNISPNGNSKWSDDEFFKIMREGVRGDGSSVDASMPWRLTAGMTDDELSALLLYLKTFSETAPELPDVKTLEEETIEIEETEETGKPVKVPELIEIKVSDN